MQELGMAWRAEGSDVAEYLQAETQARQEARGLWRDINPVPPCVLLERRWKTDLRR